MLRTANTKRNQRFQTQSAAKGFPRRPTTFVVISLLALGVVAVLARTSSVSSKVAVTVQAADRGRPYFRF